MSGAPDGDRAIGYVGAASVRKASARNPNRAASLRRLVLCLLLALGLNFLHLDAAVFAAPVAPSTSQVAELEEHCTTGAVHKQSPATAGHCRSSNRRTTGRWTPGFAGSCAIRLLTTIGGARRGSGAGMPMKPSPGKWRILPKRTTMKIHALAFRTPCRRFAQITPRSSGASISKENREKLLRLISGSRPTISECACTGRVGR